MKYDNNASYSITMELWENQNYWPMQGGWKRPLGISQYQVHLTNQTLQSNEFPSEFPLPSEWKWSDDDEWSIDKSRSFGTPDIDGWVYGPTFDRIAQNIISANASGVPTPLCLCRKRRWSRTMFSTSSIILQGIVARISHIKSERIKIQQFMKDKSEYVRQIEPFENKRRVDDKTAFHSILQPFSMIETKLSSEMSTLHKMLQVVSVDSDFACGKSFWNYNQTLPRISSIYLSFC